MLYWRDIGCSGNGAYFKFHLFVIPPWGENKNLSQKSWKEYISKIRIEFHQMRQFFNNKITFICFGQWRSSSKGDQHFKWTRTHKRSEAFPSKCFVAFRWWPSLAETYKGDFIIKKTLLHLMEFNSDCTYMLYSATAEDNMYHKKFKRIALNYRGTR
jgi:hypothetical protein